MMKTENSTQIYHKQPLQQLTTGDKRFKSNDISRKIPDADQDILKSSKAILESLAQMLDYSGRNISEVAALPSTSPQLLKQLAQMQHLRRVTWLVSEQLQRLAADLQNHLQNTDTLSD